MKKMSNTGRGKNNSILSNKKTIGIALSVSGALLFGFIVPSKEQMAQWYQASGYYFIFGTAILWLFSLLPETMENTRWKKLFKYHVGALILAFVLVVGMVLSSPPTFRILADETNLAAISASMYQEHSFYNSTTGYFYYEKYYDEGHEWGIRSLFYPFLLSIIHTITGYRAENTFTLNAIAAFFCLLFFYGLIQRWFPKKLALVSMILLTCFPLFVLCATSGGFEIVNLLFVIMAFFFLDTYLVTRRSDDLEKLGMTLILLAQLRYESSIFCICIALILMFILRRKEYEDLTLRIILFPLLLLPVAWHRLITLNTQDLQFYDDKDLFSFSMLQSNLGKTWEYFTLRPYQYNNNPVLFYLGLAGLILGIWAIVKMKEEKGVRIKVLITSSLLCFILILVVILSFNHDMGGMTHPATVRYGLVFTPIIVFGVIVLLDRISRSGKSNMRYIWAATIGILIWFWPIAPNNESLHSLTLPREYHATLDYLKKHFPEKNLIIVSERPGLYTPHLWGAVPFSFANQHSEKLIEKLERKLSREILVIQNIQYTDNQPSTNTRLSEKFPLEVLFEIQTNATWYTRISRVKK